MQILEKRSISVCAVLLTLFAVLTWSLNLKHFSRSSILLYHIDVAVYLEGGRAFLRGENLYIKDFDFGSITLPFTYPPMSAILFSALTLVPLWLSSLLFIAASVVLLWWCCAIVLRHALPEWTAQRTRLVALALLPFAVALEPVRETLGFAQVNVFLMALVLVDTLTKKPWLPRGFWIGFAASIKLTPAVFGLYFLVKRDFRSAAVAVASGIGFTALAWLISPENSRQYWFDTLRDPSRIGGLGYAGNQSFQGVLARTMAEAGQDAVWKVLVVLSIAAVTWAMYRAKSVAWAVCLNSLVALLCSPVSWTHHWVWLVPLTLLTIVAAVRGDTSAIPMSMLSLAAMLLEPHWLLPHRNDVELNLPISGVVLGSAYVWLGVAFIAYSVVRPRLRWASIGIIVGAVLALSYTFDQVLRIRHFIILTALRDITEFSHPISATPLAVTLGGPLASLRVDIASTALVLANVVALYLMVRTLLRVRGDVALAFTAVAILAYPVRDTLAGGHWTLILMALVVVDVFGSLGRLPRGLLSGVSAALGGWPVLAGAAAFAAVKNYRAVAITAAGALCGLIAAPAVTMSYLTTMLSWPQTTVVAFTGSINTTPYAAVMRVLHQPSWASWLVLVVVMLGIAHFAINRCVDKKLASALSLCLPALLLPYSTETIWVLLLPTVALLMRYPVAMTLGVFLLWFEWFPSQVSYIRFGTQGEWWLPALELFTSAPTLYVLGLFVAILGGKMVQPTNGSLAKK